MRTVLALDNKWHNNKILLQSAIITRKVTPNAVLVFVIGSYLAERRPFLRFKALSNDVACILVTSPTFSSMGENPRGTILGT